MRKVYWHLLVLIYLIFSGTGFQKVCASDDLQKVERWYESMNLKQRVGQLFLVEISKESGEKDLEEINSLIEKGELGGVIYSDLGLDEIKQSIMVTIQVVVISLVTLPSCLPCSTSSAR